MYKIILKLQGYLNFPDIPVQEYTQATLTHSSSSSESEANGVSRQPGTVIRAPSDPSRSQSEVPARTHSHSRNSSWDMRVTSRHSRNPSLDLRHSRNSSADLNKFVKNDLGLVFGQLQQNQNWIDPLRVQVIKAHHNWLAVAYSHFFICYRMKDSGWKPVFTSPFVNQVIERIAINAKMNLTSSNETPLRMIAISYGSEIKLWGIGEDGGKSDVIGTFNLQVRVEFLFFIGNQLVALSSSGKIGVWHSNTRHFQIQDLLPILSFDHAGSFLLLGCTNGSIYYIGEH